MHDDDFHNTNDIKENYKIRTKELKEFVIQVIRLTNDEVLYNVENVIIIKKLK